MEVIKNNLEAMEQDKHAEQKSPHKFKPRAPAQRIRDREPELVHKLDEKYKEEDAHMAGVSDTEEGDWIVDEYIRVPSHALHQGVDPEHVGLLVIDSAEEAQFFYGPEEDSDEENQLEDDEDENGLFWFHRGSHAQAANS
jgi:hypothetical protein